MKRFPFVWLAVVSAVVVGGVWLSAGRVESQNPNVEPTYGWVKLRSGFISDPFAVEVDSGGAIKTNLGGVTTHVDNAPDFRVKYKAGNEPALIFKVKCAKDTTLLINTPDGRWVADDDSDGRLNPKVVIRNPQSGTYDIWVGSFNGGIDPATLIVTEIGR